MIVRVDIEKDSVESLNDTATEKALNKPFPIPSVLVDIIMNNADSEKDTSLADKKMLKSSFRDGSISAIRFDKDHSNQVPEEEETSTSTSTDLATPSSIDSATDLQYFTSESEEYLKTKIQDLKCDLSAEKAIRRKKDKMIVKLAKQLKVCTEASETKEVQIYKMAKTINDLQDILHNNHHELAIDQEKIRNVRRETEERLVEHENLVSSLRKQLFNSNVEVETLRLQLQQQELQTHKSIDVDEKSSTDSACSEIVHRLSISTRSRQRTILLGAGIVTTVVAVGFSMIYNSTMRTPSRSYRPYG